MGTTTPVQLDRERIRELTDREEARLNERTQGSNAMYERAQGSLSGGVASSYQAARALADLPRAAVAARRSGTSTATRCGDFHNGFGSMVQGHAHPAIGKAIQERYEQGTHFAAPTEDAIVVAEELARRWGLPKWRYTNSGSEATMDAIRIARGHTGRDDDR